MRDSRLRENDGEGRGNDKEGTAMGPVASLQDDEEGTAIPDQVGG